MQPIHALFTNTCGWLWAFSNGPRMQSPAIEWPGSRTHFVKHTYVRETGENEFLPRRKDGERDHFRTPNEPFLSTIYERPIPSNNSTGVPFRGPSTRPIQQPIWPTCEPNRTDTSVSWYCWYWMRVQTKNLRYKYAEVFEQVFKMYDGWKLSTRSTTWLRLKWRKLFSKMVLKKLC